MMCLGPARLLCRGIPDSHISYCGRLRAIASAIGLITLCRQTYHRSFNLTLSRCHGNICRNNSNSHTSFAAACGRLQAMQELISANQPPPADISTHY